MSRRVLVTGGAHRLGGAIAAHLARNGDRVAIHFHHSAERANIFATTIENEGHHPLVLVQGDLSDAEKLKEYKKTSRKR